MNDQINHIENLLKGNNIQYRLAEYSSDVKNAAEASKQIGLPENQMLKSLLVKSKNDFLMFLVSSPNKVNFQKVNKILQTKIDMATREEIQKITGYVCPFHLKIQIPIYIETLVFENKNVGIASGVRGFEVVLDPGDLQKITQARAIDLI